MSARKPLTRRQRAVIDDLSGGILDEAAVLEKHRVSGTCYARWLDDPRFLAAFERRIAGAYRQTRVILARYGPMAAAKLVELTQCDKEETIRKACLDIIALHAPPGATPPPAPDANASTPTELPPETATRLLAALAAEPNSPSHP